MTLTRKQQVAVANLVAAGCPRDEAELLVVESTNDVIAPPNERRGRPVVTRFVVAWPDGAQATVRISAAHPNDQAEVIVGGTAYPRLKALPLFSRPSLLPLELAAILTGTGASCAVSTKGRYPGEPDVK